MHSSTQAAKVLHVSLPTFQKYVAALEGAGFCFEAEKSGARRFSEQDLQTIHLMMETAEQHALSPGKAAHTIGQAAYLSLLEKRLLLLERRQKQLEQQLARLSLPAVVYAVPSYEPPPFFPLLRRKNNVMNILFTKKEDFFTFCRSKSRLLLKKGDSP